MAIVTINVAFLQQVRIRNVLEMVAPCFALKSQVWPTYDYYDNFLA